MSREDLLDAVTAVSGSGPAYFFALIEAIARTGTDLGLDEEVAMALTVQTALGAASLAAQATEPVATLRENVTSPGGTTAAALGVLMGDGRMQGLMTDAVRAARDRGMELSQE